MNETAGLYVWIKAFHLIAVIAWMAGLLYLPRLFVYHVGVEPDSDLDLTLRIMERRLLNFIMGPAMAVSWVLGLALTALSPFAVWAETWFYTKMLAVVAMSGMHAAMAVWQKAFETNENRRGQAFYRMLNEVPTVLLIVIILMVVVKPF
ncbi:MAG: TIGR00701 family protein [Rhodospirillaceae bacterium]|nr:TIGR00701 family protein [Rhodospirillaceae bacterium]|tara:strand:- start:1660 stop:2106 length:447 start_codon:yes stop_codon:yes gene_type:complete